MKHLMLFLVATVAVTACRSPKYETRNISRSDSILVVDINYPAAVSDPEDLVTKLTEKSLMNDISSGISTASSIEMMLDSLHARLADDTLRSSAPYEIKSQTVTYRRKNILSIRNEYYVYMGGAHGSTQVIGTLYDLKTSENITKSYIKDWAKVMPVLYKKLLETHKWTGKETPDQTGLFITLDELQKPEKHPSQFYLTEQGVEFVYQQYEIAPYSYGLTTVMIPYEEWDKIQ